MSTKSHSQDEFEESGPPFLYHDKSQSNESYQGGPHQDKSFSNESSSQAGPSTCNKTYTNDRIL
ncbi:4882_t:CDS:2 [Cetraspora pellucida]|uniref:4882_t:CDS:1 n=1 Tax=Cetraspora pellucida TaxID=1433469 RepID=A0ACA9MHK6_9GLOM|nr:4882_t:CDS:2 [Cetraspora pellucida]